MSKYLLPILIVISVGVEAQNRGVSPAQASVWQQLFIVVFPFIIVLGMLVILAYIIRRIFNPWLERHVMALERIEKQLSHISRVEAEPSQIALLSTNNYPPPDVSDSKE